MGAVGMKDRDYVATGREYAEQVVAGKILSCRWIHLASERHLKDLGSSNWAYRFR